jgi:biopolymer transport protein ExbD
MVNISCAVMQVMGALSGAGFTKIGLLTDQAEKQP